MNYIDFGYSLKNILLPSMDSYKYTLIENTEQLLKMMKWKVSSANTSMKDFKNDLLKLIENIQFRTVSDKFLNKLNEVLTKFNLRINCLYLLIKPKIITK